MHDLLRTLSQSKKHKWPEHLPELYVYNATPHSSTTYSPRFLMFGQGARLPIDLLLRGDEEVDENQSDWLAEHQARLTDAYQRAEEHLKQQAEKRQDQHFEREYNIPIQKGQLVYLRNHVRGRKRFKMLGILSCTKLSMSHETTFYHFSQWNLWIVQVKLRRCIEVTWG